MNLSAIGLICKDLKASIDFYSHFSLKFHALGGEDHYEAQLPNGVRLMLDSENLAKELNPNWLRPNGSQIVLCNEMPAVNKVDEIYNELIKKGYKSCKEPWDAFWGQRYASVYDPDNNQIDLFCKLED